MHISTTENTARVGTAEVVLAVSAIHFYSLNLFVENVRGCFYLFDCNHLPVNEHSTGSLRPSTLKNISSCCHRPRTWAVGLIESAKCNKTNHTQTITKQTTQAKLICNSETCLWQAHAGWFRWHFKHSAHHPAGPMVSALTRALSVSLRSSSIARLDGQIQKNNTHTHTKKRESFGERQGVERSWWQRWQKAPGGAEGKIIY